MLTRSTRNRDSLWDSDADLKAAVKRWNKQSERDPSHPWNLVLDWVGVTELKRGRDGLTWNVHEHLLLNLLTNYLKFPVWQKA